MKKTLLRAAVVAVAVLLLVAATSLVLGKGILLNGKLRTGDTVTVPAGETWDGDLYLAGGQVSVDGTVKGDLTAVGGQVAVNGNVTGDVLAAGGNVTVTGNVDGDVRIAGGQVSLEGAVTEDVLAAGGRVTIEGDASIGGDLIATGGQLTVAGSVAGSIEGSAGAYSRTGSVGGSDHVVIMRSAQSRPDAGNVALDALRQFVVVILIGALMLWLLPRTVAVAETALRTRTWRALGYGLLTCLGYILFLIAAILVMILLAIVFGLLQVGTLVALEILGLLLAMGVISFLFVVAAAFAADALVGLTLARLAVRMPSSNRWQEFLLLATGAAGIVILSSIPILGGWVKLAVVLFGLGALAVAWWDRWRGMRAAPPAGQTATAPPTA